MRGGVRKGAGRPEKSEENKATYITKTIKFKENEKYILDYIQSFPGNNFSEKFKKIINHLIEKK
ncbi:MAG: hypothetical protein ACRCYT_07690 [Cetobacterium sp.]